MKPINRRHLSLSLLAGSFSTGVLGGCSTTRRVEDVAQEARLASLSITHPERQGEFNKILRSVASHTDAMVVSDSRVRIQSNGTLFNGKNISEQNFFIRAASETLKQGKEGFVVKQIDFVRTGTPWAFLGSNLNLSTRSWIGNYEDFRANRNEQNIFSSQSSISNKGMEGVILLLDKDEFPNRDRFTAADIYLNIVNYKSK